MSVSNRHTGLGFPWAVVIPAAVSAFSTVFSASQSKKQQSAAQKLAETQQQTVAMQTQAEQQKQSAQMATLQWFMTYQQQQQEFERQKAKETEKKVIKYGSIAAAGLILIYMLKD